MSISVAFRRLVIDIISMLGYYIPKHMHPNCEFPKTKRVGEGK